MKYYKYHKKFNEKSHIFPSKLFKHAEVVLIRSSKNSNKLFFVDNQYKAGVENGEQMYSGTIVSYNLDDGFTIPENAEEISKMRFSQLTGQV